MSLLSAYQRGIILLDWTLSRIYIRKMEFFGREHVPEGPLILASNHLNNADSPMIALAVPRLPTFMAKPENLSWPMIGPGLRIFGAFPVRRGGADLAALRVASEVVQGGRMLAMFPEGTRSRTGGLNKGHPGTALIALRTDAPILPVAITGTEGITWPWIFLKPLGVGRVTVTIGEPFHLPKVERIDRETAAEGTEIIMRRIAALLPREYRGVYAEVEPPTGSSVAR